MARGSKSKYTSKQKRKAEHIEEGYEKRGVGLKRSSPARLSHGQQIERRRQKERKRPGQKRQQSKLTQRWKKRRPEEETLSCFGGRTRHPESCNCGFEGFRRDYLKAFTAG